jgi:hypothetical protein
MIAAIIKKEEKSRKEFSVHVCTPLFRDFSKDFPFHLRELLLVLKISHDKLPICQQFMVFHSCYTSM